MFLRLPPKLKEAITADCVEQQLRSAKAVSAATLQQVDGIFLQTLWQQGFRRIPGHSTHFVYLGSSFTVQRSQRSANVIESEHDTATVSKKRSLLEDWPVFVSFEIHNSSVHESLTECLRKVHARLYSADCHRKESRSLATNPAWLDVHDENEDDEDTTDETESDIDDDEDQSSSTGSSSANDEDEDEGQAESDLSDVPGRLDTNSTASTTLIGEKKSGGYIEKPVLSSSDESRDSTQNDFSSFMESQEPLRDLMVNDHTGFLKINICSLPLPKAALSSRRRSVPSPNNVGPAGSMARSSSAAVNERTRKAAATEAGLEDMLSNASAEWDARKGSPVSPGTVTSDLDVIARRSISPAKWRGMWTANVHRRKLRLAEALKHAFAAPTLDILLAEDATKSQSVGGEQDEDAEQAAEFLDAVADRLRYFSLLPASKLRKKLVPIKTFLQASGRRSRHSGSGGSDELPVALEVERLLESYIADLPFLQRHGDDFVVVNHPHQVTEILKRPPGTVQVDMGHESNPAADGSDGSNVVQGLHYWMTVRIVARPDSELLQRLSNDMASVVGGVGDGTQSVRYDAVWFKNIVVQQYVVLWSCILLVSTFDVFHAPRKSCTSLFSM